MTYRVYKIVENSEVKILWGEYSEGELTDVLSMIRATEPTPDISFHIEEE